MASAPELSPRTETKSERIARLLDDDEAVGNAIQRGINAAIRRHKLMGVPMVVDWVDGHSVEIQPEDLPDIPIEDCAWP